MHGLLGHAGCGPPPVREGQGGGPRRRARGQEQVLARRLPSVPCQRPLRHRPKSSLRASSRKHRPSPRRALPVALRPAAGSWGAGGSAHRETKLGRPALSTETLPRPLCSALTSTRPAGDSHTWLWGLRGRGRRDPPVLPRRARLARSAVCRWRPLGCRPRQRAPPAETRLSEGRPSKRGREGRRGAETPPAPQARPREDTWARGGARRRALAGGTGATSSVQTPGTRVRPSTFSRSGLSEDDSRPRPLCSGPSRRLHSGAP